MLHAHPHRFFVLAESDRGMLFDVTELTFCVGMQQQPHAAFWSLMLLKSDIMCKHKVHSHEQTDCIHATQRS